MSSRKTLPVGDRSPGFSPQSRIYDAADFSSRRGTVKWTSLDTSKEIDAYSRGELLRKGRWLIANTGFGRGLIKNSATLIGWKTPHARTDDDAWNKERDRLFAAKHRSRRTFDVSGKFSFKAAQNMLVKRELGDGDCLIVFSKDSTGSAMCAFYESHQLANPKDADPELWKEGVRIDKHGKHLAYGVKDGDKVKVIQARDAMLFGTFESVGHVRPHPPLGYAINHALDVSETRGFWKLAIKNSSLFGVVSEKAASSNPTRSVGGMETSIPVPAPKITEETQSDGTIVKKAEVFDGGQVIGTNPGEKMSILTDDRPHPNSMNFEEAVLDEIAAGWGVAKEVVLMLGKKLTGPSVRFIMNMADQWIEDKQALLDEFCLRYWVYDTALEIESGRLREPSDENWMQKLKLTKRRSLTIDRGKEGKQRLDELDAGAGTLADWVEETTGDDWRDHVDQVVEEHDYKAKAAEARGYKYAEIFRPRQGAAAPEMADDEEPVETEED